MTNIVIISTVGLALLNDPTGTARLVTAALSVRGVTWIAKKVTENINLDASQIIDFTGWSIAGVSIVGIVSNAIGSIDKVESLFGKASIGLVKIAEIVDKITFWS